MRYVKPSSWPVILLAPLLWSGCAADGPRIKRVFPPAPTFPQDHRYTLDDLVQLAIHNNSSLDVARWEAEAAQGLVDQVKALWLPTLRYNFAALFYDNDKNYEANVFDLATLNVPITGPFNLTNAFSFTQILGTGGKRTSGLKQAKMFARIKELDVFRIEDQVVFDVANFYHLVCLTNEIDTILDDATRRLRVFRQVAEELNGRGSLRAGNVDAMQADYFVMQLEQLRVAVRAGRHQAYQALRTFVGVSRNTPLPLASASLPAVATDFQQLDIASQIIRGFQRRPENNQVNLFTKIREQQVEFAKAEWRPNFAIIGTYADIRGPNNTIIDQVDGLLASFLIDLPLYNPARRGRLREALGMEHASKAFQKQVEELITLEIEVTAVDAHSATTNLIKADRAQHVAARHYQATRQAYSRELIAASNVVTAIALDMLAKIQHQQALFNHHTAMAKLRRVTADRDAEFGY